MLISLQYAYLVGDIIFLIFWLILYYFRKDLRKEMIIMGVLITITGVIAEYYMWTKDWWKPPTITGTIIGIEDFLLGFTNGGIAAVLYEEIFRKRLYRREKKHNIVVIILFIVVIFLMYFLFKNIGLTSAVTTIVSFSFIGIILMLVRKDLFISSIINGILMVLVCSIVYYALMILSPGYVEKIWVFNKLSGIIVTGIPLEDIIFYFLVGFLVAPLYEYWQGERLRAIARKK